MPDHDATPATIKWIAHSVKETDRLGQILADELPPGTVVSLIGTLGAGKTRLVQAVAAGIGVTPGTAVSPTFTLCNEYHGRRSIFHIDLYRVADDDEFFELGFDELFQSDAISCVEWGDRFDHLLPRPRLEVELTVLDDSQREIQVRAIGDAMVELVQKIRGRLGE